MTALTLLDLHNALNRIRQKLLIAAGTDGMVSQKDLRQLTAEAPSETERLFYRVFYKFIKDLENRPNMRVTEEIIDQGVEFIKERLLPHFEIAPRFSEKAIQQLQATHPQGYSLSVQLQRLAAHMVQLPTQVLAEQISQLTDGLIFDDFGSEADQPIKAFYLEADLQELTPTTFVDALGLDPDDPKRTVARFVDAEEAFWLFIDLQRFTKKVAEAQRIVSLMRTNLVRNSVIILGEDNNPALESQHPLYVVGLGSDGDLAGFQSQVIWT